MNSIQTTEISENCKRCGGNIIYRWDQFVCLQCARSPEGQTALRARLRHKAPMDPARRARRAYYRGIAVSEKKAKRQKRL